MAVPRSLESFEHLLPLQWREEYEYCLSFQYCSSRIAKVLTEVGNDLREWEVCASFIVAVRPARIKREVRRQIGNSSLYLMLE